MAFEVISDNEIPYDIRSLPQAPEIIRLEVLRKFSCRACRSATIDVFSLDQSRFQLYDALQMNFSVKTQKSEQAFLCRALEEKDYRQDCVETRVETGSRISKSPFPKFEFDVHNSENQSTKQQNITSERTVNIMRNQRETNRSTPSLSSMGYLTMIVALAPSVAGFSGLEQPFAAAGLASGTGPRTILRSRSRTAVRSATATPTQLHYIADRSSDLAQPTSTNTRQAGHSSQWWNSIFGGRDESNAADDYLEFLDKRYNRILNDEEPQESKGFPVLNWLYQTGSADASSQKNNHEEDALYVLGVANLASKKLLQKHHLLPEEDALDTKATPVMDAEIVGPAPVAKVSLLFRQVAHRREIFLRSQMRYTRLALAFAVRQALTGPIKAARKLYAMGGGRKSVALTLAALAAVSFLLRPVVQVAASDVTGGAISY